MSERPPTYPDYGAQGWTQSEDRCRICGQFDCTRTVVLTAAGEALAERAAGNIARHFHGPDAIATENERIVARIAITTLSAATGILTTHPDVSPAAPAQPDGPAVPAEQGTARGGYGDDLDTLLGIDRTDPEQLAAIETVEQDHADWPDGHPCRDCDRLYKDHSPDDSDCEGWR